MQHLRFRYDSSLWEAIEYTGDNLEEVIEFTGKHENFNKYFKDMDAYKKYVAADGDRFKLINDNGKDQYAFPGDWIIRKDNLNTVIPAAEVELNFKII